jgi:hypothetical protein
MSGVAAEKVVGDKATISIGGSVFNLKLTFDLNDGSPATRSVNSNGFDYAFGAQDGEFLCEIEASTPDITTIRGWRVRDSNGKVTPQATIISLPPVGGGATVTGSFNAAYHRYQIVSVSPDGFVLVRLTSVITSDDVTWA